MEDIYLSVERHSQQIKVLERDVKALREVQTEIRSMNETLLTLANELKHTNQHLTKHEKKIEEISSQPQKRMQQVSVAVISAIFAGLVSFIMSVALA
ncbi:MAG: hypothetical protein IKA74_01535 [Clostridia bacterium]|nr:hypothetical protein [Clostridia bacterium]